MPLSQKMTLGQSRLLFLSIQKHLVSLFHTYEFQSYISIAANIQFRTRCDENQRHVAESVRFQLNNDNMM